MWIGRRTAGWHGDTIVCCVAPRWSGLHVVTFTDIAWRLHLQLVQQGADHVAAVSLMHTLSPSHIQCMQSKAPNMQICLRKTKSEMHFMYNIYEIYGQLINNYNEYIYRSSDDVVHTYMLSSHVCPWWYDDVTSQCNGLALVLVTIRKVLVLTSFESGCKVHGLLRRSFATH